MFNVIADLGFSAAHVKRISEGKDLGECIGTYATIKILLTVVMVALVISGIAIWKYVLHNEFFDCSKTKKGLANSTDRCIYNRGVIEVGDRCQSLSFPSLLGGISKKTSPAWLRWTLSRWEASIYDKRLFTE